MTRRVGVIKELYPRERPGTKKVSGLVLMEGTKRPIEFTGILSLTQRDVGKTRIMGTISSSPKGRKKLIRAKRF